MGPLQRLPHEARTDLVVAGPFPVPPSFEVGVTHAADGVALRYARWRASAPRRDALIMLMQGRTEYIERYGETISLLLQRGFDVLAFDWRGQGGSARLLPGFKKGHVGSFDDYRLDLDAMLALASAWSSSHRLFALAHSMGGAVLLHALSRSRIQFEKIILSAPMIGLSLVKHPRLVHGLAHLIDTLGWGAFYIPGGTDHPLMPFSDNPLTHDALRFGISEQIFAHAPDLAIASPTIRWVRTSFDAMSVLQRPETPRAIATPVLCVAGPHDRITDTAVTRNFVDQLPNGRMITLDGAEHEILLEEDQFRTAFWQAFDAFVAEDF